jgi:hypothetical protein
MRTQDQRLRIVERLLFLLAAVWIGTIGAVLGLWRSVQGSRELRARAFVLTNESDSEIAKFEQGPNGPLLVFRRDRQTLVVGALTGTDMGVAITADSKPSAQLSSDIEGSSVVTLYGQKADAVASLAVNHEQPIMSLRGPECDIGVIAAPDVYFRIRDRGHVVFQVPPVDGESPGERKK